MSRLLVRVAAERDADAGTERWLLTCEEPPADPVVGRDAFGANPEITALLAPDPPANGVKAAGRFLFDWLAAHPQVGVELLQATQGGVPRPVMIDLRDGAAEAIPWEALCSRNDRFLALDPRWPVSRAVLSVNDAGGERILRPPLRITLLLSAAEIPAAPEWREIWKALLNGPVADFQVLALVGEPALGMEISALGDPRVRVEGMPSEGKSLANLIREFAPHIVHAFCHGAADDPPYLELATAQDWLNEATQGSLQIDARQINGLSNPNSPAWLAVLNCCEVGAAGAATHALARQLVNEGPYAAALAMREPVEQVDATALSASFYPGMLDALQALIAAGGDSVDIDWAALTVPSSIQMCESRQGGRTFAAASKALKQWTLPVLYQRPTPFSARLAVLSLIEELELQAYRNMRASEQPGTARYAAIEEKIAELEARA